MLKRSMMFLFLFLALLAFMPGGVSAQDWFDSFEDYDTGSFPSDPPDPESPWNTWSEDPFGKPKEYGAISTVQALSGDKSLMISDENDIIVRLSQVASGLWTIKVNYYIPTDATGTIYFILMNEFTLGCPGGMPCNWALQLAMNCNNETLNVDGVSRPLVLDDWALLEVQFDLNSNLRDIYYNGELVSQGVTYVGNGTAIALAAIDLYAAGGSGPAYMDDISVAQIPAPFRAAQDGLDIVLDWGTPPQANKTSLDISAAFNADIVAAPGEDLAENDSFDNANFCLIQDEYDGTGIANPLAQGLPENGLVGQFQLGEYEGVNAIQYTAGADLSELTIDLENGNYGSILYCVSAGSGQVTVPVTVTYTDTSTEDAEITALDWYANPTQGLTVAIDNMDRINIADGIFADVNNPALFSGTIALDSGKTLDSITLKPAEATADWAGGAGVVFNLMALTAVEHIAYELERVGVASGTETFTFNELNVYRDVEVPDDTFTYTLKTTVGGIALEDQTATITWQDAFLTASGRVGTWLLLGHFPNPGGASPGVDALLVDYLTDGTNTEADILPVEGMVMALDPATAMTCGNQADCNTWFRYDTTDGYVNFNNIFGDIDNVMTYMATYLVNNTDSVMPVMIGCGSDDSIAILLDNIVVHANSVARGHGFNGDRFLVLLPPGEHRLLVKVFEGGGGHGGSVGFYDPETGNPLQPPEIELNPDPQEMTEPIPGGGDGPGEFRSEIIGEAATEVELTWTNSEDYQEIFLYRNDGTGILTRIAVAADATSVTDVPGSGTYQYLITALTADGDICGTASTSASTGVDVTINSNGYIRSWLMLGPLAQTNVGQNANNTAYWDYLATFDGMTESQIVPTVGMEMEIDFDAAASTAVMGPTGNGINPDAAAGIAPWSLVHYTADRINYTTHYGTNYDWMMVYNVCYITNETEDLIELTGIVAADDTAVAMIDNQILHMVGWTSFDEAQGTFNFTLLPGEHRLMIKVFEQGGGDAVQFRLQDPETLEYITADDDRFSFSLMPEMETLPEVVRRELPAFAGLDEEFDVILQVTGGPVTVYEQIPLGLEVIDPAGGVEVADGLLMWENVSADITYKLAVIDEMLLGPLGGYAGSGADWAYTSGDTSVEVVEILEGWMTKDIADSGLGGFAEVDPVDGKYEMTITASGSDIWGTADDFRYVWREYPADGTVTIEARLDEFMQTTNTWAKAGIMFRTNTTQGSPYVFGLISVGAAAGGSSGRNVQWRDAQGANAAQDPVHEPQVVPVWIRAVYNAGMVDVYFADDDDEEPGEWMLHASHELNTAGASVINGGIAVTSHDDAATVDALFSSVTDEAIVEEVINVFIGDTNNDGRVDLADAIQLLTHLFVTKGLPCLKSGDANNDGKLDLADAISILTYQFQGGMLTGPDGSQITSETVGCHEYLKADVVSEDETMTCETPCQ